MLSAELQDQASGLRRLLGGGAPFRACGFFGPDAGLKAAAAASLASALARRGETVLILDEAEAPRNVAGQFGLAPRLRLTDVVQGRCTLERALAKVSAGVRLLAAGQSLPALALASEEAWDWFLDAVNALDEPPGWIIVNAPAAQAAPALACGCPDRLLVVPDRKAVLTEAYAVLKAVHQLYPDGHWRVLAMNGDGLQGKNGLYTALANTAQRFLGVHLDWFGAVPKDEKLAHSARMMKPLFEVSPDCPAALAFKALAETAKAWPREGEMDAEAFWQRLYLLGRLAAETSGRGVQHAGLGRKYG